MFTKLLKGGNRDLPNIFKKGGDYLANLITLRRAKEEIKRLQDYVDLAENYEANTLEKFIIKEYAFTNSIEEITRI